MGARIFFYIFKDKISLKELMLSHYTDLRDYCFKENADYFERYDDEESYYSKETLQFLENTPKITTIENIEQGILDELISELMDSYQLENHKDYFDENCDLIGPCMSKSQYKKSTNLINQVMDSETKRLWNYLVLGRSLLDDKVFKTPKYGGTKTAFWIFEDWQYLQEKLIAKFGNYYEVRANYWTEKEKANLENASLKQQDFLKPEYIALSNHNPITAGIEYVLQVFASLKNEQYEILISVEV